MTAIHVVHILHYDLSYRGSADLLTGGEVAAKEVEQVGVPGGSQVGGAGSGEPRAPDTPLPDTRRPDGARSQCGRDGPAREDRDAKSGRHQFDDGLGELESRDLRWP